MRLLLTTDTVGGVWTYTQELTEGLLAAARDAEPHAVALASIGPAPSPEQAAWATSLMTRFPGRFEFHSIDAPLEWQSDNSTSYTAAEPASLALAEHFQPDLLHTSQFCFGALPLNIPRVVVAHSDVFSWAEATRSHGLEPSPWLDQYRALVQQGLTSATCVVAPTHAMHDALARHLTLPARTAVIPNGRSLPSLFDRPPHRKLQAVTAGRLWDEAKNVTLLATITSPLPIFLAGEHRLPAPITAPSIHLLGPLPQARLLDLFWQSSIYICTSIYEPFGLAPLEAALCGCAILCNDIPSLREVWGDAALFFHDAASLTHLLQSLVADPAALTAAQHRAHDRAALLSGHTMTNRTLALFRELLHASSHTKSEDPHAAA